MTQKTIIVLIAVVFGLGALLIPFADKLTSTAPPQETAEKRPEVDLGEVDSEEFFKQIHKTDETPVEIDLASVPEVVASVNGHEIEREAYTRIIKSVRDEFSRSNEVMTAEKLKIINQNIMDSLTNTEMLYHEAMADNITVDDATLAQKFEEIQQRFPSTEEFEKSIAQAGTTIDELKKDIEKGTLIEKLLEEKVFKFIVVSEQQARQYYDENTQAFDRPETVKARHILIKLTPDAAPEQVAEAEKRMLEIIQKKEEGSDFAELAKQYSEGPSGPQGGELGYFGRGQMVKEFEDAAFDLKVGETSGIVRTQFGLHFIEVTDRRDAGKVNFDDATEEIITSLKMQQRNAKLKEYVMGLKEKADIRVFL